MIIVMHCHQGGDRYTGTIILFGWGWGCSWCLTKFWNIAVGNTVLSSSIAQNNVKRNSNMFEKNKLPCQVTINSALLDSFLENEVKTRECRNSRVGRSWYLSIKLIVICFMLNYLFLQIFNISFVVVQVEWINAETPTSKLLNFVLYCF